MRIYRQDTNQIGIINLNLYKHGAILNDIAEDMIRSYYHTGDKRITFNKHMGMFQCSEHDYHMICSLFANIEFLEKSYDELDWSLQQQSEFMQQFDHLDLWDGYFAAVESICEILD